MIYLYIFVCALASMYIKYAPSFFSSVTHDYAFFVGIAILIGMVIITIEMGVRKILEAIYHLPRYK